MHHFGYKAGALCAEDVSLNALAQAYGTPCYVYSAATLTRHIRVFRDAFGALDPLVCYALKANSNQAVITLLAKEGAGMDVVSGGELLRTLKAGVDPKKITFSGVGKTLDEMDAALACDILCFNVESVPELDLLSARAAAMGRAARVAVRVNPDVDAKTHEKITTGKSQNKFGIPLVEARAVYAKAARLPFIEVTGVDMHIGSQITDLAPFASAFSLLNAFVAELRQDGHTISHVDLGGGLGVPYEDGKAAPPDPAAYAAMVKTVTRGLDAKLILEPGRLIVANAGILLTRVLYVKEGVHKRFIIVDGAMNDLIRPTLYDAWHAFWPENEALSKSRKQLADVVGPVCESGDYLALERMMPQLAAGDLLAVMSAGAYGAVQASTYNTRALVPEVMVHGARHALIRPRLSAEEQIARERVPDFV